MELEEAITILENHNQWRRNNDILNPMTMVNPKTLGIAIDTVVECGRGKSILQTSNAVKPPLGLTPKWVRDQQRFDEICEALSRYYNEGKKIPIDWLIEYNSLAK